LNVEETCSSETSSCLRGIRLYSPEYNTLHSCRRYKNLKSSTAKYLLIYE
jgi:hypothetical protein